MTERCLKTLRAHEIALFIVSIRTRARQARGNCSDWIGRRQGNSAGFSQTRLMKALVFSLLFHVVILAAMIFCFGGKPAKHQEMITVFLSDEEPSRGAASGKAGTSGGAAVLRAPRGADHASTRKKKNEAPSLQSLPSPPPTAVPLRETKKEKTAAPEETNVARDTTGPPAQSSARSPLVGGPGDAGGTGSGGGGSGMGRSAGRGAGDGAGGGGFGAGSGRGLGAGSGEGQPSYLREHYAYIKEIINKSLQYPPVARRMGWQGVVQITFVVLENGFAEHVRITKSSGHAMLDQAVVKVVQRVQPFPRPPAKAELTVPVVFRLENGAEAG